MTYILLFFMSIAQADLFIKLEGQNIMGHNYSQTAEYPIRVQVDKLVNEDGDYMYKYDGSKLVPLIKSEIDNHPLKIEKQSIEQILTLKKQAKDRVRVYDCSILNTQILRDICTLLK